MKVNDNVYLSSLLINLFSDRENDTVTRLDIELYVSKWRFRTNDS